MEERRKFVRLDTRLNVSFTLLPQAKSNRSMTKGISGGGICFFADEPLSAGTRLQAEMTLPDRDKPIPFTAEVMWSEQYQVIGKTERKQAVEIGVRFIEIAPADRETIMQHVILSLQPPNVSSESSE